MERNICLDIVIVVILSFTYIECYPYSEGDIRLIGGTSVSEGTLLIFHDNKWGAICDYGWDIRDAHVACRQLGYSRALQYLHGSRFGRGRRRMWLADVYCRGRESTISDCYNPGWGRFFRRHHRCRGNRHSAGVVCLNTATTTALPSPSLSNYNNHVLQQNNQVQQVQNILLGDEANNMPVRLRSEVEESETDTSRQNPTQKVTTPKPTQKPTTTTTTPTTTTKPTTTTPTTTTTTTQSTTTPTTTTTTPKPTTKPTTQKPVATTEDMAAKLPRMKPRGWTWDKAVRLWVLPLRSGKYYISKPGRSARKMTKEEYISARRKVLYPPTTTSTTTTPSYVYISREVSDEESERESIAELRIQNDNGNRHERMKSDDPLAHSSGVVLGETEEVETTTRTDVKIEDESDMDDDVGDMMKETEEDELTNKSFNVVQQSRSNITSSGQPTTSKLPSTTTTRTTTMTTTTTTKPTTTTTTTKPTTKTSTTTTTRPTTTTTTIKPTTTSTQPTTRRTEQPTTPSRTIRETTIYDRAANLPDLTLNKWTMDVDVIMWVLKLDNGKYRVSKPGQPSKLVTRDEYIAIRREILQSATATTVARQTTREPSRPTTRSDRHDEMKADDPGIQSASLTLGNSRGISLGNVVEGGRSSGRGQTSQRRIGTGSVDSVLSSGAPRSHHRHRHSNSANYRREKKVQIRVSGGRSRLDGRIEVLPGHLDTWGVICGDHWTIKEAMVACRHFNLGYALQAAKTSHYGGKYQKKYYSRVRCKGNEDKLDRCQWEDHNGAIQCKRSERVAGIVCSEKLPDLEPSTYMVETTAFLQDRHMYYLTCAMEENCLAPSAYELKRTSRNWRTSTRRLLRFSSVVKNKGTADFKPISSRSDWEWHACHMHYHSMEIFAHYDIVDSNGNRVAEGLKASFCLEDSQCDRGVRPKYECQHYGQQGISVGCSDNYMADIDCQWIDISDLKPGNYFFKLQVNPNLHVAELDYDNNAMKCRLHYTGYYARISDCKLESIL